MHIHANISIYVTWQQCIYNLNFEAKKSLLIIAYPFADIFGFSKVINSKCTCFAGIIFIVIE